MELNILKGGSPLLDGVDNLCSPPESGSLLLSLKFDYLAKHRHVELAPGLLVDVEVLEQLHESCTDLKRYLEIDVLNQ